MVPRITVSLTTEERKALFRLAEADFRPPKDQMRWLVRKEAERRGWWPGVSGQKGSNSEQEGGHDE